MMPWRLKQCPDCSGDLYLDNDGKSWFCLQCGRSIVEQNRPLAVDCGGSHGYHCRNRRPQREGQGVAA